MAVLRLSTSSTCSAAGRTSSGPVSTLVSEPPELLRSTLMMVAWAGRPGADATGGKGNLDGWGAVTAAMMGTLGSWDWLVQNDEDHFHF
jgi:hypothetical protein